MILKDRDLKNYIMYKNFHSWRRKLRLQSLVNIPRKEIELGKEFDDFSHILEQEIQIRWKLVSSTRRQNLNSVKKILAN